MKDTFTFNEMVQLADVDELRARKWIDRRLISFDADLQREGDTKHRRFTVLDVIRAALISQLNDFGFDAERASEDVENLFRQVCEERKLRYYPPAKREPAKLIQALQGTMVFIRFGRERIPVLPSGQRERIANYTIHYEKDLKKIHPSNEGALLTLFVGQIVNDVYGRIQEIQKETEEK